MNIIREKKSKNPVKGFTLIEVILVIVIVGIVFLGIYGLFTQTVKHDTESRYEVIASNLAQEGIEMIRNARDENIIRAASYKVATSGGDLEIDENISDPCRPSFDGADFSCSHDSQIEKNGDGWYQNCLLGSCDATRFYRECDIQVGAGVKSLEVTCKVCWESFVDASIGDCDIGTVTGRMVTVTSYLTDWAD